MATTQQAPAIEISIKPQVIPEQNDVAKGHIVNVNINGAQILPAIESTQVGSVVEKPTEIFVERLEPRSLTLREVSEHKTVGDLWIVVDNGVYDVTNFQHNHPGGQKIMAAVAGKDATKKFDKYHRRGILESHKPQLLIGTIVSDQQAPESRKGFLGKFGIGKR